ncbi:MAG: hypothetical protein V9E90_04755 [Saprospiraceae bacterium]
MMNLFTFFKSIARINCSQFIILISSLLLFNSSTAQIPKGLNFQTIVRDNTGKPLVSRNVNFKFSILQGGTSGTLVYAEEHRAITNEFGLVNLLLGYGFPLSGKFDQIKWADGSLFLKTEIDPNGGINYELSNVSPFLSVPYALYAENTQLTAGPGILIEGNKISNTGDPDPADDLKNGSPVGGDLSGTLPNPKVTGLQNRPVMDINPQLNQALVWNGTQWLPVSIDNDPTNDLLINSPAGGDLIGNLPNPKVIKLNGFPLASTAPDSGDVLVFSQGEWKHLPIGSSPSAGVWKRSANDVVLEDPAGIQRVNASNALIQTQNSFAAYKGSDSTAVSPVGIQYIQGSGAMQARSFQGANTHVLSYGNKYLYGLNSFTIGSPYAELEFWNNDLSQKEIRAALNPFELRFDVATPDRGGFYYGTGFTIDRKVKDSPLEYAGVELRDSSMYFYSGNKDFAGIDVATNYGGGLFTYDKNGKDRMYFSSLNSDQTQPYIGLFSTKTNRAVAELQSFNSAGEFVLYNSNTDQFNVYAGYSTNGPNYPWLGIGDANGGSSAGMYLSTNGLGTIFADIKNFRMDDPADKDREIWYACIEGPEAAAYERGTGHLVNGEAFVFFSDHFKKVINPQSITVQLTPGSAETFGVAVVEKNADGFRIKELQKGTGNFSFDWEVKAVRQGYESYEVYHKKENLRAVHETSGFAPSKTQNHTIRHKLDHNSK